jgi:glycosyltransferase involved in cell wall biosynthesis
MKPKVLVVCHFFPYYRLPIMKTLTNDPAINYTFFSGMNTDIDIKTLDIETAKNYDIQWMITKNYWFLKTFLWQHGLIKESFFGRYDAIIFLGNPYFLSTWLAVLLAKLAGKKVFYWAHATIRQKRRDKLKVLFFRMADHLLVYGNHAKNDLVHRFGFEDKNITVVYNSLDYPNQVKIRSGINQAVLAETRKKVFANPEMPIIIFIGRFVAYKHLEDLIEASKILHQRGQPHNLLLIGDGEEKSKLVDLVKDGGLESYVNFFGACFDESDLAPLIAMADICVSPGNVGLTAIHSLTYGTPVITHDNPYQQGPEFEAIQPHRTGLFFQHGSLESMVEAISQWLSEHQNSREEVRKECYEIIDKFYNPQNQAACMRNSIVECINRKNKPFGTGLSN